VLVKKPRYKLRFPSPEAAPQRYLSFTESGALMIEKDDFTRPWDERCAWLAPEDTIKFLHSIGEQGRQPEFTNGDPTRETQAMLRRLIKQFSSIADLSRCWKILGIYVHGTDTLT